MSDITAERIRLARNSKGYTGQELAEIIGISQTSVSSYERGIKKPSFVTLKKISSVLGVSVDYLMGLTDDTDAPSAESGSPGKIDKGMSMAHIIPSGNLIWIPVISPEIKPSAGNGNCYAESDLECNVIEKIPLFDGELSALYSTDTLLSMYVDGDSMEPQIHHNDLVVFNHDTSWVSGNVMVVCLDGRLLVKGVVSAGQGRPPILRSTNKEYEDIQVQEDSFFVIYGRVLRIIRVSKPKSVL